MDEGSPIVRTQQVSYEWLIPVNSENFLKVPTQIKQHFLSFVLDINLCSHIWSVCYLAESIFNGDSILAEPCSRKCPTNVPLNAIREARARRGFAIGYTIPMGQSTPLSATGSYCIRDTKPPFCPKKPGGVGDSRCCMEAPEWNPLL